MDQFDLTNLNNKYDSLHLILFILKHVHNNTKEKNYDSDTSPTNLTKLVKTTKYFNFR